MKTALITGGLGFIGSNIVKQLIEKKIVDRCVILDTFSSYVSPVKNNFTDFRKLRFTDFKKIVIERGDAKDFILVYKIIKKHKPEFIFHTAAVPLAKIDNLNAKEAKEGSIDTTTNILESVNFFRNNNKKYKLKRFIYFSSSMIYGDFKKTKAYESDLPNPKEIYGAMKLAGEIVTKGLCGFYHIPYTIVRPSAVYGPTDMNNRVTQIFINKAFNNDAINIQGKDEKLDFTYVEDLADGCIKAGTKPKGENQTFNITYGKGKTFMNFAKILKKHFPDLEYKVTNRDAFRPKRGTLSISKAKKLLGYKPKYNLEKGIDKYINFLKSLKK